MGFQQRSRYRFGMTPYLHACAGVMCGIHQRCARYANVDETREPSAYWLGNCSRPDADGLPEFVGYIPLDFVGPPSPHHWTLTRPGSRSPRLRPTPLERQS